MARASVPQFGNWENEDNVPYTVYFDKARKNKGGKIVNPNDPEQNPDMFPGQTRQQKAEAEEPVRRVAPKASTQSQLSKEDSGEYRQYSGSPAHRGGRGGSVAKESSNHGYGGSTGRNVGGNARPSRPPSVGGSEYSIDRSPLHPSQHSKLAGRGNGSPAYEGKKAYESIHGTPSRLRPKTPDNSNSRDVAIPKFGDWDVSNPQSADNYTYIFNKNARGANPQDEDETPSHNSNYRKHGGDADAKFSKNCCFPLPWGKK